MKKQKVPEEITKAVKKLKENPSHKQQALLTIYGKIDNNPPEKKLKYIWALGEFEDNATLKKLSTLTSSEDKSVKLMTYTAMARTGTPEAISELLGNYDKENNEVLKECIRQQIIKLEKNKLFTGLIQSLNDDKQYNLSLKMLKELTGKNIQGENKESTVNLWQDWWQQQKNNNQ